MTSEQQAIRYADASAPRRWLRALAIDTRPLDHPVYRRLYLGQATASVGIQVTHVAVPFQVWNLTHSSMAVAELGLFSLVPLIVFGLWGGAVADHVDRRKLLFGASCITWVSTLLLLIQALLELNNLWLIYAVVSVQATGFAISGPTRGAIIPRIVDSALVPAANTLNYTTTRLATFLGPMLAGVLLARFSYSAAYALDAVLFTLTLYASLRLPSLPPQGEGRGTPGLGAVVDGFRYLTTQPVLLMSFVVDLIAMAVAMPRALFPELAETRFGGQSALGWLFASIAIGEFLGGISSGWIGRVRRQGLALVAAVAIWGLAVAAAGLANTLWLAVTLLAVGGAADLVSAVFRQSMLQTYAPDKMRGRIQGLYTVVVAGGPRLGDLRAGALAVSFGASASWVAGGVACAVLVVLVGLAAPALLRYEARSAGREH